MKIKETKKIFKECGLKITHKTTRENAKRVQKARKKFKENYMICENCGQHKKHLGIYIFTQRNQKTIAWYACRKCAKLKKYDIKSAHNLPF